MKYIFTILLLLPLLSSAQPNMVPNGDFETYTTCPTGLMQMNICTGWNRFGIGTPDYFHTCNTSTVKVPNNLFGYQNPASGAAYAGAGVFFGTGSGTEYITRSITPLTPGLKYTVSMSVSLSNKSLYSINHLGILFYDNGPSSLNHSNIYSVTPQIDYSNYSPVSDTANWVRLSKTFTADSAYDNIVIGRFNQANTLLIDTMNIGVAYAYYYFDSIVVKKADTFRFDSFNTLFCVGDTFSLAYYSDMKKQSNNTFTVQLSDALGNFSSPTNIGSKSSDTSGTILVTIPKNTPHGTAYKIRLVASNYADTTDESVHLKIVNMDSIVTTSVNSPLCEKVNLLLTGSTTSTGVTWQWNGPNSFTSTVQSPTLQNSVPLNSGDYYATATLNGCSFTDTIAVLVKPTPANLDVMGDTVCAGATATLNAATTSTGVTWQWTGPNSFSSTAQNNSFTNTTPSLNGVYTLSATLNGCTALDSTKVLVNSSPTPVTLSHSDTCDGDTLRLFSTSSTTGAVYAWAGPNSFTASTQNTNINNAGTSATGWYKMTVGLNGCSYVDSIYATVHAIPQAPAISYNSPLCEGQGMILLANTIQGATYSWTGPNGFNDTGLTPTKPNMQFTDAGTYHATVTVNGCTSPEDTVSVSVKNSPFVTIATTPSDTICVGNTAQFNATPNNHGGSPSYQWYINTNPAGTSGPYSTNLLKDGDTVYCVMTEYTQCSAAYNDTSSKILMTVLPWETPTVVITSTEDTIKSGGFIAFGASNTFGGKTPAYQWKLNGNIIGGAIGAVWSANSLIDKDEICVEMTSSYQCPTPQMVQSNCINVIVRNPADVKEINKNRNYTLYPNPNNGSFVLKGNMSNNQPISIKVISTVGTVLYNDVLTPKSNTLNTEIKLNNLATGVYFVRLQSESGMNVIPFTVR